MIWHYDIDVAKAKQFATSYGEGKNCDVVLIMGHLYSKAYDYLYSLSAQRLLRRKDVLLILSTHGGNPHIAYRLGRYLQASYNKVTIFVPGICKSAGTLLATAAHDLIMTDNGELGPIDVQQTRLDEWDPMSGLVEHAATLSLEDVASRLFSRLVTEIKKMGRVTFKTAADTAAPIVAGALSPIYAQIDPLRLGETTRGLRISKEYAERLNEQSKNLKTSRVNAAEMLVSGYSDHSFVIDRKEAEMLFERVSAPCDSLKAIRSKLGPLEYDDDALVDFLNEDEHEESAKEGKRDEEDGTRVATTISPSGVPDDGTSREDGPQDAGA